MQSPASWWTSAAFSIVMLVLAATCNAAMDKLSYRYGESVFAHAPAAWQTWLDPRVSWHNKWRNGDRKQGEAFPLSSTALVAATDAWHFFKSLMLTCIILAVVIPLARLASLPWWGAALGFVALQLLWGAVFEFFFRWGWGTS